MKTLSKEGCVMKKVVMIIFLVALVGCSNQTDAKDNIELQLGHALSPGTAASDELERMAEAVEERTNGTVTFDIYGNSKLGSETEMLQQIQMGAMDAGAIMIGSMQTMDMRLAIEDLPYMWKDEQTAREAYEGEFGDYLSGIASEYNLHQIGYLEWGFRHITNNSKPIVEPEDVKNLDIRVAETALRVDTFEALGAMPTVMAFSEVYGALQQGALDAQENPLANIVAPRFYEVQNYLSLTGHFYNTVMVVVSEDTWNEISKENQEIILEEMKKSTENVYTANDENESSYLQELEENGMQINDDVNTESFREKLLPVYDKWEEKVFGKELMDVYRKASGFE